jgi:RHS repeat-associated protein
VNLAGTETVVAKYNYDAMNRRIRKLVSATTTTTDFIYTGWRCVEDRNPFVGGSTDTPTIQYIWGRYLDELLQLKTLVSVTTGVTGHEMTYDPDAYYPLQDLLYRTTATTNSSGVIVEAYDFDAYGNTLIFNAPDTGPNWWGPDAQPSPNSLCEFLFTGQRFDAETGLYYYKRRMYSAGLGRFLSKDPIGFVTGAFNLYLFTGGNPATYTDPLGLVCTCPGGKWTFVGIEGGAAFIVGYSLARGTARCDKAELRANRDYNCKGCQFTKEIHCYCEAAISTHTPSIGVQVGAAGVGVAGGFDAATDADISGGWGVSANITVAVIGVEGGKGTGGSHTGGLGLSPGLRAGAAIGRGMVNVRSSGVTCTRQSLNIGEINQVRQFGPCTSKDRRIVPPKIVDNPYANGLPPLYR